jgi:transcription initiation factor IIE alpha subunit
VFDKETVEVTCANCGHKSQGTIDSLKRDGYICPKCGTAVDTSELLREIKEAERGVRKLERKLSKSRERNESG